MNSSFSGTMSDKDIASSLLMDSKHDITGLSKCAMESTNPQLRNILTKQLNSCMTDHFKLSDMAIKKQWYDAYASPEDQIEKSLNELKTMS
jgi:similar to spore coat protein